MIQEPSTQLAAESAAERQRTSSGAEYYDTLLARLYLGSDDSHSLLPTVGVTSCLRGEGVSTVAANLAIHSAHTLLAPVLLLEVAAGPSTLARIFGVDSSVDLTELLSGSLDLDDCFQPSQVGKLSVISATLPQGDWGAVQPPSVARVFEEIRNQFAFAVVDLPPVATTGPCLVIAPQLDGMLLTVEAERASSQMVQRAKQLLLNVGANPLGIVLNKRREHVPRWLRR